jgi:hypothetical protein
VSAIDEGLLESVLDALAHAIGADDRRTGEVVQHRAALGAFDGFEIFDPVLLPDDFILTAESPTDVPIWPMDVRYAMRVSDEGAVGRAGWLFKAIRTLDPKAWRGKLRVVLPKMIEHGEMFVAAGVGESESFCAPYGLTNTGAIPALAHNHPQAGMRVNGAGVYGARVSRERHVTQDVLLAHGVAMRREYLWSVLLGERGAPRARYVTDPVGVREAFRLRDIPDGKQRRTALRHWVRDHWRRRGRESEADHRWILAHMRGAEEFSWSGLQCRIEPSRQDERRNSWTRAGRAA